MSNEFESLDDASFMNSLDSYEGDTHNPLSEAQEDTYEDDLSLSTTVDENEPSTPISEPITDTEEEHPTINKLNTLLSQLEDDYSKRLDNAKTDEEYDALIAEYESKEQELIDSIDPNEEVSTVTQELTVEETDYSEHIFEPINTTDNELVAKTVAEVKAMPKGTQCLHIITNEWDSKSTALIASEPSIMKFIAAHIEDGTYSQVMNRVNTIKQQGMFKGVPDVVLYRSVGISMANSGQLQTTKQKQDIARKNRIKGMSTPRTNTPYKGYDEGLESKDDREFMRAMYNYSL